MDNDHEGCLGRISAAISRRPLAKSFLFRGCPASPLGTFQCSRNLRWPGHSVKFPWQQWFTGQDANLRIQKAPRKSHHAGVCFQAGLWGPRCHSLTWKLIPGLNHIILQVLFLGLTEIAIIVDFGVFFFFNPLFSLWNGHKHQLVLFAVFLLSNLMNDFHHRCASAALP